MLPVLTVGLAGKSAPVKPLWLALILLAVGLALVVAVFVDKAFVTGTSSSSSADWHQHYEV